MLFLFLIERFKNSSTSCKTQRAPWSLYMSTVALLIDINLSAVRGRTTRAPVRRRATRALVRSSRGARKEITGSTVQYILGGN